MVYHVKHVGKNRSEIKVLVVIKGAQLEILGSGVFRQTKPACLCDLRTKPKKSKRGEFWLENRR
jgi:hypothetical protein